MLCDFFVTTILLSGLNIISYTNYIFSLSKTWKYVNELKD